MINESHACCLYHYYSVVVILCGGNIDTTVLGRCLDRGLAADGRLVRLTVLVSDKPGGLKSLIEFLFEQGVRLVINILWSSFSFGDCQQLHVLHDD